jgi:hypothetical protein
LRVENESKPSQDWAVYRMPIPNKLYS